MLAQEFGNVVGEHAPPGGEVEGAMQLQQRRAVAARALQPCRVGPEEARRVREWTRWAPMERPPSIVPGEPCERGEGDDAGDEHQRALATGGLSRRRQIRP